METHVTAVHNAQCTLYIAQCTFHNVHCTHCALHNAHNEEHTIHIRRYSADAGVGACEVAEQLFHRFDTCADGTREQMLIQIIAWGCLCIGSAHSLDVVKAGFVSSVRGSLHVREGWQKRRGMGGVVFYYTSLTPLTLPLRMFFFPKKCSPHFVLSEIRPLMGETNFTLGSNQTKYCC